MIGWARHLEWHRRLTTRDRYEGQVAMTFNQRQVWHCMQSDCNPHLGYVRTCSGEEMDDLQSRKQESWGIQRPNCPRLGLTTQDISSWAPVKIYERWQHAETFGSRDLHPCPQGERAAKWVLLERTDDGHQHGLHTPYANHGTTAYSFTPLHRHAARATCSRRILQNGMQAWGFMKSQFRAPVSWKHNGGRSIHLRVAFRGSYPACCTCCTWSQF